MKKYKWVVIFVVIICVILAYISKINANKFLGSESVETYPGKNDLITRDIVKVTYPVYVGDNGKYGSIHNIKFEYEGKIGKVAVKRVREGDGSDSVEFFWLNNYRFNDSGATVYILGDNGGDYLDVRVFNVTKVNGELVVKAEPVL